MNSDHPFTVHGDEALEARIVAWVLGEASAFEEAELERLCEERPELLVFRHRMRALHGLLTEAEKQQPDEGWKLPEEKRKLLDEIFGETKVVRLEAEKETRVRHTGRKILLAIAASLVIGFVVLSSMPTKYESTATFEIRPRTPGLAAFGGKSDEAAGQRGMTPGFFGTEFEIIKSRNCLEKVVDNLNLQSRWNVDKETALAKLKGIVQTQNVKGTDLITIRVRDSKPDDLRDIAEEVARTYKTYREGLERKDEQTQLAKLRKAVQAQEDKVEERRKVLSTIVRTKGIIYKGSDSFYNQGGVDEDQGAKNALSMYHDLEQEKIQLDSQIKCLEKYDNDQLMVYASGLDLPDNIVRNLYPKYLKANRQLEAMKINGQGDRHPTVLAAEETTERMKKQLDEGVDNLRATLQAQLNLTSDRFETVKSMKDNTRDDAILRGLDAQDYVDAKREFENDQELLQQMKLKLIGEDTSSDMQIESVKIHEKPVEAKKVGPLQSIFGLFGNREPQPKAELADAKTVRFSAPSSPAPAQSESSELLAGRSLEAAKAKTVPLRPEFPPKPIILPPIADAPADGLAMNEPQVELRSNPGQPAPANKPAAVSAPQGAAEVTSLSSVKDRLERKQAAAVAGAKDSEVFFAGKKTETPARPASQPLPQPTTAAPAAAAAAAPAAADTDLAKLMSSDRTVGDSLFDDATFTGGGLKRGGITLKEEADIGADVEYDAGFSARSSGGLLYEKPKSYAGMVLPSDRSNEQAGNSAGTNYYFSVDDAATETDLYGEVGHDRGLADGSMKVWESTKAAEFGRKVPEVRFAGESESPPPSLSDSEVAQSKTNGNRSGDFAKNKNSIDAVLADPYGRTSVVADPIRTNAAETSKHEQSVDTVRKNHYIAEGNFNLGKYDDAKKSYEDVLRADPYNSAARRGLERINQTKADYYRAAYDHTRAELLSQVDSAWEIAVPEEQAKAEGERETLARNDTDAAELPNVESKAKESLKTPATRFEFKTQDEGLKAAMVAPTGEDPNLEALSVEQLEVLVSDRQGRVNSLAKKMAEGRKSLEADKDVVPNPKHEAELVKNRAQLQDDEEHVYAEVAKLGMLKAVLEKKKAQESAKPDLSKLIEEVAASEEPYSTFSLNISDASFQIAQAAMAKGERPDPAGVKVEQFYNAVDYGDPAPAAGEPVAVNIEQSAHPVIPGRNLVRVALKTAAAGRAASQPLHLTLLVDQSGSMSREDRRTAMKQALGSLGGLLSNNDSVTVVGFSRTPRMLADGLSGDQSKKLPDLINVEASEGGTNLEEAMKLGEQLAARHKQPGAQNRIVLFTDGAANLGNADPEKLAERVKQLRQKGIALDIAGIAAADLNDELLAELARNGNGRYYVVGKGNDDNFAKQLAGAFRPAAENVKVQVHFNPERVSRYKLIGFEKDRLKTEDFRNDAVDAAEMAAEEAGVAIYQIEPIPGGKGEIGEVSVRFRDTTAGQMVERTWAISHNPSTPSFDRAAPSMQLATFAMLAAEKLKGGAYAEAIDFKQLSAPQANVKQFYGDQGRPAEVLRMVDALK